MAMVTRGYKPIYDEMKVRDVARMPYAPLQLMQPGEGTATPTLSTPPAPGTSMFAYAKP